MGDFRTLREDDVPRGKTPPSDGFSSNTVRDIAWNINQLTEDGWHIELIGFRQPAPVTTITLKCKLNHESGAKLHCRPLDPWSHHAGQEVYRAHRIKATGPFDNLPAFLTLSDGITAPDTSWNSDFREVVNVDKVNQMVVEDSLEFSEPKDVKKTDQYVKESMPEHGIGTTEKAMNDAVLCLLYGATYISNIWSQREQFGSLVAKPRALD